MLAHEQGQNREVRKVRHQVDARIRCDVRPTEATQESEEKFLELRRQTCQPRLASLGSFTMARSTTRSQHRVEQAKKQDAQEAHYESQEGQSRDLRGPGVGATVADQLYRWTIGKRRRRRAFGDAKLVILATALQESNMTMTQNVRDIVNEHSTPIPTTKGLKAAVDKMDKARKKLREAEKARYNMHSSWRRYIADSLQRCTQFAEKFGKDDQELAERVKAAKERLQKTKEEVEAKKAALEELDEEDHVDISDEEMNEKVDSAENIQVSLTHMVESLNNVKQQADAAIVEAGENKPKRQRTEEHGCGGSASETLGSKGKTMEPFGKPGK